MLSSVGVALLFVASLLAAYAQEPIGGVIADLVFFDDAINPEARFATFLTTPIVHFKLHHYVRWDGTNEEAVRLGSGLYIYAMKAGGYVEPRKMLLK